MVPRTEIVAVDLSQSIEYLSRVFVETKLSKVLIFKENIDHVIGYAHSIELFKNQLVFVLYCCPYQLFLKVC